MSRTSQIILLRRQNITAPERIGTARHGTERSGRQNVYTKMLKIRAKSYGYPHNEESFVKKNNLTTRIPIEQCFFWRVSGGRICFQYETHL